MYVLVENLRSTPQGSVVEHKTKISESVFAQKQKYAFSFYCTCQARNQKKIGETTTVTLLE